MAAFIAKQMVGDKLNSVKGAMPKKDEAEEGADGEKKEENEEGEDPEVAEMRREIEEKRKEKHRKAEEEREDVRQGIRDKYGLKKKVVEEPLKPEEDPELDGRLGRKKKTPAEMAADAEAGLDDDAENDDSFLPANMAELQTKFGELPGKLSEGVTSATEKCSLQ